MNSLGTAFALVTFGSGFFHGSETQLGGIQDTVSNNLFAYLVYQAGVSSLPPGSALHDLALTPRNRTAAQAGSRLARSDIDIVPQMVDYWLEVLDTQSVEEWRALDDMELPSLQRSFAGMVGLLVHLETGNLTTTLAICQPLLQIFGVNAEDEEFFLVHFLPAIADATQAGALVDNQAFHILCSRTSPCPRWRQPGFWRTRPAPSLSCCTPSSGRSPSSTWET